MVVGVRWSYLRVCVGGQWVVGDEGPNRFLIKAEDVGVKGQPVLRWGRRRPQIASWLPAGTPARIDPEMSSRFQGPEASPTFESFPRSVLGRRESA